MDFSIRLCFACAKNQQFTTSFFLKGGINSTDKWQNGIFTQKPFGLRSGLYSICVCASVCDNVHVKHYYVMLLISS